MATSTGKTILLISDDGATDRELRVALGRTAPEFNFGVVQSRNEIEGFQTPNVILLDLMLSYEPPFDVLRWLRTQERFEQVPVFALGSEVMNEDIDEAYALGANSCILKNPDADGLDQIARGIASYAGLLSMRGSNASA